MATCQLEVVVMKSRIVLLVLLFSPVVQAKTVLQLEPPATSDAPPAVESPAPVFAPPPPTAPPPPQATTAPPAATTPPPSSDDSARARAWSLDQEDDPSRPDKSQVQGGALMATGTIAQRQAACDAGATLICFGLGRTVITGLVLELEDARISYKPAVSTRTGLRAGWGIGFKAGLDFWDWIPLQVGVRHASPNDDQGFSEPVVDCTQEPGAPAMCEPVPHSASTTAGAVFMSIETGVEPSLRLAKALALSPGLFLGYAGTISDYTRSVPDCVGCTEVSLDVNASAPYIAPSLRLTWLVFGLSVRYERYLSGDLRDAFAIALDLGARSKAVAVAFPGEKDAHF
jgi:hypothetical protein